MKKSKYRPLKFTAAFKKKFLSYLIEYAGNVTKICPMLGVTRQAAYLHRQSDPDFAESWDKAVQLGVEALIDEATRRAHEGYDEPVFHNGEICGYRKRYSDSLLMFMIRRYRPEFKDSVDAKVDNDKFGLTINIGDSDKKVSVDDDQ